MRYVQTLKMYVIPTVAEFVGTALFQILGGSAVEYPAFTNGAALAVLVYLTAPCSSGHINPYISLSLLASGHFTVSLTCLYVIAQIAGAVVGAAAQLILVPHGNHALLGCFGAMHGATAGRVVFWESIQTYVLVLVNHNVCLWRKSFAAMGPLVIGLTLTACALSGGYWTGGSLNLARLLGPTIVHGCDWRMVGFYALGQLAGTVAAVLTSVIVNGIGPTWKSKGTGRVEEEQRPVLVKGSMSPGIMSHSAARENESRLAPALTTIPEPAVPTMLDRYINDDSHV